jgi:HEPN domain-containing protein
LKPLPHALNDFPPQKQAELVRIREIVQEELQAKITSCRKARTKRFRIVELIHYPPPCQSRPNPQGKADALLLIIVSHRALAEMSAFWEEVEDRLCQDPDTGQYIPCLVHTRNAITQRAEDRISLLNSIVRDGCNLFSRTDGGSAIKHTVSVASENEPPKRPHATIREDYSLWKTTASQSVFLAQVSMKQGPGWDSRSAFLLHQASENAYRMFFSTVTAYTPATHQLRRMRHLARAIDCRLEDAWQSQASEEEGYFDLLCRAYIEARYSLTYRTSEAALRWQADRVAKLIEIADALCLERLSTLGTNDPVPEICQPPQTLV